MKTMVGRSESLSILLVNALRNIERELEPVLSQHELTPDHGRILLVVRRHGVVPMKELSDRGGIPAPSTTRHVDRLVSKGLVSRRADDVDRRKVLVVLTSRGTALADKLRAIEATAQAELLATPAAPSPDAVSEVLELMAGSFAKVAS